LGLDIEAELDDNPAIYRAAFLIRADQARQFAVYGRGPVTDEIAEYAEMVAREWTKLAAQLRLKLAGKAA